MSKVKFVKRNSDMIIIERYAFVTEIEGVMKSVVGNELATDSKLYHIETEEVDGVKVFKLLFERQIGKE